MLILRLEYSDLYSLAACVDLYPGIAIRQLLAERVDDKGGLDTLENRWIWMGSGRSSDNSCTQANAGQGCLNTARAC